MKTKRRLSSTERQHMQQQALSNAVSGQTMSNYPAIFNGFLEKGIPESEIKPRENIFTYHAWRALGRQVRRGERGVRVVTWIPVEKQDKETGAKKPDGKRCWTAVVFHISQTDPIGAAAPTPQPQAAAPALADLTAPALVTHLF